MTDAERAAWPTLRELEGRAGASASARGTRNVESWPRAPGCSSAATCDGEGIVRPSRARSPAHARRQAPDLVAFCASEEHAELRLRFAVTTPRHAAASAAVAVPAG